MHRKKLRSESYAKLARAATLMLMAGALGSATVPAAFARSWSYHYKPVTPQQSPAAAATEASLAPAAPVPAEQLSTARLLKRSIVSDLAVFVKEQPARSDKAYSQHSDYVVHQLALFDPLSSQEALGMFGSLSGYYLSSRGEQLYDCLALRKGKSLKPFLEQYLINGNTECSTELGQTFAKPSVALDGNALCASDQQQKVHLAILIAEIDSGTACPDSALAALTAGPSPASAKLP